MPGKTKPGREWRVSRAARTKNAHRIVEGLEDWPPLSVQTTPTLSGPLAGAVLNRLGDVPAGGGRRDPREGVLLLWVVESQG